MTDAALPVTQSSVERFTEQYLTMVGCIVEKHGDRWNVTAPNEAETGVLNGETTLICGDLSPNSSERERTLHPESAFFQELITEASKRQRAGMIALTSKNTQIEIPEWIQNGDVEVADAAFTPYYDRTAVVILYRISIETVSEYQTELLRAVALDTRSQDPIQPLEDEFLNTVAAPASVESTSIELNPSEVQETIEHAREVVIDRTQSKIDEIHQEASRASDAEIEEYRQLQQQRIEELEEKASRLSSQIDDLSTSIQQSSTQDERMQSLEKRKELKSEYEDIDSKLENLQHRRDQGFPEKQQEIRERHALEVVVTPLTVTQVEYERGEVEFKLEGQGGTSSMIVGYGSGVGVTESVRCEFCDQLLTNENPIRDIDTEIRCLDCWESSET